MVLMRVLGDVVFYAINETLGTEFSHVLCGHLASVLRKSHL